uniref:Uncharacterized protein n=1 Tax=Amphimedon queenslandica TaxID=400682 RepID=A0A1X7V6D2_AMPQE
MQHCRDEATAGLKYYEKLKDTTPSSQEYCYNHHGQRNNSCNACSTCKQNSTHIPCITLYFDSLVHRQS